MSLYLIESVFGDSERNEQSLKTSLARLEQEAGAAGVRIVEVQVARDFGRSFLILEAGEGREGAPVEAVFERAGVPVALLKPVRLVGSELEAVKRQPDGIDYLVEWNIPEDLTMEQYLERKKRNSVHYAEVPEVTFSRTYVCEDMSKCLCFYRAPDEAAVVRARNAVQTPIDAITALQSKPSRVD
ncbi:MULTISPECIES: DUF4242 domain-containing protein [Cohnella]|uniref:DUF4242 domain-containing protein n=1 Tax=Cohnella TaxID=329857 RepID=UPI0009BAE01D|nr:MULTISPECIES: DUF4242 domain-containing protein [Cohnella]MBN2984096.1 DUF4242 domain-containing protein [Cohnella algarum]